MRLPSTLAACSVVFLLGACGADGVGDLSPTADSPSPNASSWGPESPKFNLEVILRGDGFGHVKFRQPNDQEFRIYLDVWVRDLAANATYTVQRGAVGPADGNCTDAVNWLTLGTVSTDERGTGTAALTRVVPSLPGATFDIQFRVLDASGAVVLSSTCYQYTISQ
ncbi:MAG TPA: hypothetical protein VH763_07245 [Gemmatimonadales bacterium]|jgi:hypothetical protein